MLTAALALALAPAQQLLDLDPAPPVFPEDRERGSDHALAGRTGGELILGARIFRTQGSFEDLDRNVLIASDGTPAGTRVIAELDAPGSSFASASRESAELPGGHLVLQLVSEPVGAEVFLVDATTLEVRLLSDVNPGRAGSNPRFFTAWQDRVWFRVDTAEGPEIWSTDGSAAGTVRSSLPLAAPGALIRPAAAGANLFVAGDPARLLVRQATDGGWTQIRPPVGGAFEDFPSVLGRVGDRLLLAVDEPASGTEPWACDGTQAGLLLLADANPGPTGSSLLALAENGAQVLFRAKSAANGQEPWISDGTAAGTFLLADLQGGLGSGLANIPGPSAVGTPDGFYFSGSDGVHGAEVWFTDGTTAGTALLLDHLPGPLGSDPLDFLFDGGAFYFTAQENPATFQRRLYRHDPGVAGYTLLSDTPAARPLGRIAQTLLMQVGSLSTGRLFTNAGSFGSDAPLFDADPIVTSGSSDPQAFERVDFRGLTFAAPSASGLQPFVIDPATLAVGEELHVGPAGNGSAPLLLGETSAGPLFVQTDGFGSELHLGVAGAGPGPLLDLAPGAASATIRGGAPIGGRVLFHVDAPAAERGLWSSDGTLAGTLRLAASDAPPIDFAPGTWTRRAGAVWFAFDGELWRSDGVTAAPAGLALGALLPAGARVAGAGGRIVFETAGAAVAPRLWALDPASGALEELLVLGSPGASAALGALVGLGERALFHFASDAFGDEPWSTDGTARGTRLLADCQPGPEGHVADLVATGTLGFFLCAAAPDAPRSLWRTDGTAAGTQLVSRGNAAAGGLVAERLVPLGVGRVAFRGVDPELGHEPWTSDGTAAGTLPLADLAPGPRSSYPDAMQRIGGSLFVAGYDLQRGREPFAVPLDALAPAAADPVGVDCGARLALAAGTPSIGAAAAFRFTELEPGVPAALLFSGPTVLLPLGGGCVQYVGAPKLLGLTPAGADGSAVVDVSLPLEPTLVGRRLALQGLAVAGGGPLFGLFEVTQALDVLIGG